MVIGLGDVQPRLRSQLRKRPSKCALPRRADPLEVTVKASDHEQVGANGEEPLTFFLNLLKVCLNLTRFDGHPDYARCYARA